MTARSGMSDIIRDLRILTEAGTAEWTLGTITFWDDDQLQNVLDDYYQPFTFEPMEDVPTYGAGGTLLYNVYEITDRANIEKTTGGTSVFYLQDGNFSNVGTALYSIDYKRGIVTFSTDTQGTTTFYATGKSYDINAAAAQVWRVKANHYATAFDFTTDNTSVKKSQVYQHCLERAEHFEQMGQESVIQASITRSDDVE